MPAPATLSDLGLPAPPIIVGHRGACGEAAENTLASIALAIQQSADMIEIDLHLTSDGVLLASHDCDLSRTAGMTMNVEESLYEELRHINVAQYFTGHEPATMPRVEEVLDAIPRDFPINLELKCEGAIPEAYVDAFVRSIRGWRGLLVSSFDWNLLFHLRRVLPEVPIAPLAGENAADLPAVARALRATSAHCSELTITPEIVASLDVPCLVYTVNEIEVAEALFAMGVAGVFTNFPGRFAAHFRAAVARS